MGTGFERLSRADLLRRAAAAGIGVATIPLIAACGDDEDTDEPAAAAEGASAADVPATTAGPAAALQDGSTIKLFAWQGYDDEQALAALKADHGVTVQTTYIAGDQEVFTKLGAAGGDGLWDILTYNSGLARGLFDLGAFEPIDPAAIPNAADIIPQFIDLAFIRTGEGDTVTGFPFSWGYQGFVRTEALPALGSWEELFDPAFKGRIVGVNDPTTSVATMALAAGFGEYDKLTKDQLDEVMGLWRKLRPNLRTITSDYGAAKDLLVRGEIEGCVPGWQAMVVWAGEDGATLVHDFPKEGVYGFLDLLCVIKGTKDLPNAMGFVDYMLSPEAQASLGSSLSQGITNAKAVELLPQSLQDVYQYASLATNFESSPIRKLPPFEGDGEFVGFKDWAAAWERFTAGS